MIVRLVAGIGIILALGALLLGLLPRYQQAARQEAALEGLQRKQQFRGLWRWRNTEKPNPRLLEPSRRAEISKDYQNALDELGYASQSGDPTGLPSYFIQSALEDAKQAAQTEQRQNSWGHELYLNFYAPDGATVGLTDSSWVGFIYQDVFEVRRQVMDVVLRLSDGNWRVTHWRVLEREVPKLERPSRLTPEALAQVRGVNYVGRLHPFGDFWQNFDPQETRSSFRLAKALGLGEVRFFIPYPTPEVVYQHLPELLKIAASQQLRLMPTLLDSYTSYRLEDLPAIYTSFERLLPMLRHQQVFAIDVKNEAERDAPKASWRNVRGLLRYLAVWLSAKTNKPITAGLTDPDELLASSLDFVTVHHYGAAAAVESRLQAARQTGKPVLLQEFGFHTQLDAFPDPHTELEQAQYFAQTLAITKRLGVGFMVWNLYDFDAGAMPGSRQVERHLGLIRSDGSLKPVVNVLLQKPVEASSWLDKLGKVRALLRFWWVAGLFLCLVVWVRQKMYLKLQKT
jgi:hypothetical protein